MVPFGVTLWDSKDEPQKGIIMEPLGIPKDSICFLRLVAVELYRRQNFAYVPLVDVVHKRFVLVVISRYRCFRKLGVPHLRSL